MGTDGGFVFEVIGGNDFNYTITNGPTVIIDQGTPNSPIAIPNLPADLWVIEVSELNNADCKSLATANIQGGNFDLQATFDTTFASECGVNNGSIVLNVTYPDALNITTDQGTVPNQFTNSVTISDLYDGIVNITVSDANSNCSEVYQIELPNMPNPQIEASDYTIVDLTCPSDSGAIMSNVGVEFSITELDGTLITETPWINAPADTFWLHLEDGYCLDSVEVIIDGPPAYVVEQVVVNESCIGTDGSIVLDVTGSNPGGYVYFWPNGESNTDTAFDLSAGSYAVTIEDGIGCEHVENVFVDSPNGDCEDCDFIFFTDTIFVDIAGVATEICLPTPLTIQQFDKYDLNLDGNPFTASVNECDDKASFYPYNPLLGSGYTPFIFRLDEWLVNADSNTPIFEFTSIFELVDRMNQADPAGNWVVDTSQMLIIGGNPNNQYGSMVLNHTPSNGIVSLEPGSTVVFNPSITVNYEREHILIAFDPLNPNCSDTLIINLLTDNMPTPDSIFITVEVGATQDTCLDISELGILESINNECLSFTNNAQWISYGDECITVEGMDEGSDEFCLVLCDDNGLCDTTYVIVEVQDGGTDIQVLTGFSPNGDGINDFFKIGNIEDHPRNDVAVFNRWGNRVYKKKKYTNTDPWRGEYNNQILPDGTYFYLLDVEVDGEMKSMKGYVQIRR